jgi:hypothetical protein
LSPLLFIALVELMSKKIHTKKYSENYRTQIVGSSSGWGSRCPRYAGKMKIYVQQTCTESKTGEDSGNVDGIRPRWKEQELNLDG